MQFNYYFLRKLSKQLETILIGAKIKSCFSQNKEELILTFTCQSDDSFCIRVLLDPQTPLLSFSKEFARARKNSVDLFDQLIGQTVTTVTQFENERSFLISTNQYQLLFKLHGKRANLILFEDNKLISIFRKSIINDQNINLDQLHRPIDQSNAILVANQFDLRTTFPTFDKQIYRYLTDAGFDQADDQNKPIILRTLLEELDNGKYYLINKNGTRLSLLPSQDEQIAFDNPIEVSNEYSYKLLSSFHFNKLKNELLAKLRKELKKSNNYIGQGYAKLEQLAIARKYDELANILMANLHVKTSPEQTSIKLLDFYTNEDIKIKIKKNSTLQNTAANYYKKSKNQSKEIGILEKNISSKESSLIKVNNQIEEIEACQGLKELRSLAKQYQPSQATKANDNPFMNFVIDGYDVWIGKNAKNNDLLTQKYANKNDLWMHAKDVSGSHAVIRFSGSEKYPMPTIEKVAQLVGWHSKRKNDTLCPVIYTLKKYVRKPKGSLPGQVIVTREDVVMVEPKRHI